MTDTLKSPSWPVGLKGNRSLEQAKADKAAAIIIPGEIIHDVRWAMWRALEKHCRERGDTYRVPMDAWPLMAVAGAQTALAAAPPASESPRATRSAGVTDAEVEAAAQTLWGRDAFTLIPWSEASEKTRAPYRADARAALQAALAVADGETEPQTENEIASTPRGIL